MNISEATAGDVGVNLCSGNRGVAEEFLDDAEVRAVFEQVSGETVSEHVRRNIS